MFIELFEIATKKIKEVEVSWNAIGIDKVVGDEHPFSNQREGHQTNRQPDERKRHEELLAESIYSSRLVLKKKTIGDISGPDVGQSEGKDGWYSCTDQHGHHHY